jgi:hypothetical protein
MPGRWSTFWIGKERQASINGERTIDQLALQDFSISHLDPCEKREFPRNESKLGKGHCCVPTFQAIPRYPFACVPAVPSQIPSRDLSILPVPGIFLLGYKSCHYVVDGLMRD